MLLRCLGCGRENKRMLEVSWVGVRVKEQLEGRAAVDQRGTAAGYSDESNCTEETQKRKLGRKEKRRPSRKEVHLFGN